MTDRAQISEPNSRRKKSAKERREQRQRSDHRMITRLLSGLMNVNHHRGGKLSKVGLALRDILQQETSKCDEMPSDHPHVATTTDFFDWDHLEQQHGEVNADVVRDAISSFHVHAYRIVEETALEMDVSLELVGTVNDSAAALETALAEMEQEFANLQQNKDVLELACDRHIEDLNITLKRMEGLRVETALDETVLDDILRDTHARNVLLSDMRAELLRTSSRMEYPRSLTRSHRNAIDALRGKDGKDVDATSFGPIRERADNQGSG